MFSASTLVRLCRLHERGCLKRTRCGASFGSCGATPTWAPSPGPPQSTWVASQRCACHSGCACAGGDPGHFTRCGESTALCLAAARIQVVGWGQRHATHVGIVRPEWRLSWASRAFEMFRVCSQVPWGCDPGLCAVARGAAGTLLPSGGRRQLRRTGPCRFPAQYVAAPVHLCITLSLFRARFG
jgi:hypothetical protein